MNASAARFWLMKSEPETYSIDDLGRDRETSWEGVRNYQARNSMREMNKGDLVLFYHSSADPPGVAGVARVAKTAYPDPKQFDTKSDYYDAASKKDDPRWSLVDLAFVEKLPKFVPLESLKAAKELEGMLVIKKGQRLSVQPVERAHFAKVLAMGGSKTKLNG